MRRLLLIGLLLIARPAAADIRAGDLVFHVSRSAQGRVIRAVTGSQWSHVGVVLERDNELFVVEAAHGVTWTPLERFRRRGQGQRLLIRRLPRALEPTELAALHREADRLIGRRYDTRFEWGDARLYCSELVFLIYERALHVRLAEPLTWRELQLNAQARALARRRLGRLPRPTDRVITPGQLASAAALITIAE